MFEGGEHCPYDSLSIYDGHTNEAPLIAVLCGKQTGLEIYSTYETLHIEFRTKSGRPVAEKKEYFTYWELDPDFDIKRRGFKAFFEFSDKFVRLGRFISNSATHIRGTECDQHIESQGESNGSISSPNYPNQYPLNTTCFYYLDGLMDSQYLENVKLTFKKLDMPKFTRCTSAKVSVYLDGQMPPKSGPNRVLCGSAVPQPMLSTSPRLVLEFSSTGGQLPGTGFSLNYSFLKDYDIPGTPVKEATCHFIYHSSAHKSGVFNSPRHPAHYPNDVDCVFEFRANPGEGTTISFSTFQFHGDTSKGCVTDWLEIYQLIPDPQNDSLTSDLYFQRYCGNKEASPGPITTSHNAVGLKILFHSNNNETDNGFKAHYRFWSKSNTGCMEVLDRGIGGVITSPSYPEKYSPNTVCEWNIIGVRPLHRIMLHFTHFLVETADGCQNAVLRIYTTGGQIPDYELCGDKRTLNQSSALILTSSYNKIRLSFTSSSIAQGKKGFEISWTEILRNRFDFCNDFECKPSGLCISQNLTCNGYPNCGLDDDSDENANCPRESNFKVAHLILGCVVALLVILIGIVCFCHVHRKRANERRHAEINHEQAAIPLRIENRTYRDAESIDEKLDKMLLRDKIHKVSAV